MTLLPFPVRLGLPLLATLIAISVAGFSRLSTIPALPPMGTRPGAITKGGVLLHYRLGHPCRPLEVERLEQIKAVLYVLVSAPVLLADFPAKPLSQGTPAHVGLSAASCHVTWHNHTPFSAYPSDRLILTPRTPLPPRAQLSLGSHGGIVVFPDVLLSTRLNKARACSSPFWTAQDPPAFVGLWTCLRASGICRSPSLALCMASLSWS